MISSSCKMKSSTLANSDLACTHASTSRAAQLVISSSKLAAAARGPCAFLNTSQMSDTALCWRRRCLDLACLCINRVSEYAASARDGSAVVRLHLLNTFTLQHHRHNIRRPLLQHIRFPCRFLDYIVFV